ncbi:cytochrome P450 [Xylogone sp. PMI_703]|nr:cytochrome P450 [Xylogone sp. PMI_703]
MLLTLALFTAVISVLYVVSLVIQRLVLSPIAHFPGPKLAALTWWYQFYYDVIKRGQYLFKIQQLHSIYGPVIRINPCELHVVDPEFMDVLYAGPGRKRDKWDFDTQAFRTGGATLSTNSHDLHRIRRAALNPFFSKTTIRKLQPLVDGKVDQLLERFAECQRAQNVLVANHVFAAFTNDVVTNLCFGTCHDRLGHPAFDPSFHDAAIAGLNIAPFMAQFPIIMQTLEALPQSFTTKFIPAFADYIEGKNEIRAEAEKAIFSTHPSIEKDQSRTIFHEILDSKLPPEEKLLGRLGDEAAVTVGAGTLTTSWILCIAIYYLLTDDSILDKLKLELENSIPDPESHMPLPTLEALPYLNACIREALRLGYGVPGRVSRVAPDESMVLKGLKTWVIPPGTPTSMSVYLTHHDERIFPNSKTFRPERWLENPRLDRYLCSFAKGSRACIGMNLAYAELFITIGRIFRNYGSAGCRHAGDKGILELFDTGVRDIECTGTTIVARTWSGSQGVRFSIRD